MALGSIDGKLVLHPDGGLGNCACCDLPDTCGDAESECGVTSNFPSAYRVRLANNISPCTGAGRRTQKSGFSGTVHYLDPAVYTDTIVNPSSLSSIVFYVKGPEYSFTATSGLSGENTHEDRVYVCTTPLPDGYVYTTASGGTAVTEFPIELVTYLYIRRTRFTTGNFVSTQIAFGHHIYKVGEFTVTAPSTNTGGEQPTISNPRWEGIGRTLTSDFSAANLVGPSSWRYAEPSAMNDALVLNGTIGTCAVGGTNFIFSAGNPAVLFTACNNVCDNSLTASSYTLSPADGFYGAGAGGCTSATAEPTGWDGVISRYTPTNAGSPSSYVCTWYDSHAASGKTTKHIFIRKEGASGDWVLTVHCNEPQDAIYTSVAWRGTKSGGTTPAGTYNRTEGRSSISSVTVS